MAAPTILYAFLSLVVLGLGFTFGMFIQRNISRKSIAELSDQLNELRVGQTQLQLDYNILLKAMQGAKIQAENYQRELLGTNIIEVQEHEDPEMILNRHLLADFIYKKLVAKFAKSDQADQEQIPGDPQIIKALESLDDRVVDILAKAIK